MRDRRRLAFLLGEEQSEKIITDKIQTQDFPNNGTNSSCMSSSGASKRIQNKIKTDSKTILKSESASNSPSSDILNRTSTSSSCSRYDSAELVANVLAKSRSQIYKPPSFKSNSVSNLRKKSPPMAIQECDKIEGDNK